MAEILEVLMVAGAVAAILGGLAWLASRLRRRGGGAAILNPVDEIFNPGAHRFRAEIEVQEQRMTPLPSADDQPDPVGGDAGPARR